MRGYYALPLLWRDQVIGWGNVAVRGGALEADIGYVAGRAPREAPYRRELEAELDRMRAAGCTLVGTEAALFEWTRSGDDVSFRQTLKTVKTLP